MPVILSGFFYREMMKPFRTRRRCTNLRAEKETEPNGKGLEIWTY